MTLASIIATWAILWVLVAAAVIAAGRRRGWPLPAAAAWLVTIGAFLAAQEDPLLLVQMASTRPSTTGFRDGVLGLVHAHTRGHMYGAAILALAGLGLAVVIAHAALRRAEAWAWWEAERLTWPSAEVPGQEADRIPMVRRRSTVRFHNGAPAQRDFSNWFLMADFTIK